jgi:hypothetical protein
LWKDDIDVFNNNKKRDGSEKQAWWAWNEVVVSQRKATYRGDGGFVFSSGKSRPRWWTYPGDGRRRSGWTRRDDR